MSVRFSFNELEDANLIKGAIYEEGFGVGLAYEPLYKLLPVANTGGFRACKRKGGKSGEYAFIVLYSTQEESEWPDYLDGTSGRFVYFGDNRRTDSDIHSKLGNRILRHVFAIKEDDDERRNIPPFFVFTKLPRIRHVKFHGLAVPGHPQVDKDQQLVVTTTDGVMNYRASFMILDIPVIHRAFIYGLIDGNPLSENAPIEWKMWVEKGDYGSLREVKPLKIDPIIEEEVQIPISKLIRKKIDRLIQLERSRKKPKIREKTIREYERNTELVQLIRSLRGDKCQICGDEYQSQGGVFCDTHHIVALSEGGLDTSENIIVVCPSCHRKFHLSSFELNDKETSKSVVIHWFDEPKEVVYWRKIY